MNDKVTIKYDVIEHEYGNGCSTINVKPYAKYKGVRINDVEHAAEIILIGFYNLFEKMDETGRIDG